MKKFKLLKVSQECHRIAKLYATAKGFTLGEVTECAITELIDNDSTLPAQTRALIKQQND